MEEQQKIERDKRVHRRNREGTKILLPEKCQYNKKNQPKAQDKQVFYKLAYNPIQCMRFLFKKNFKYCLFIINVIMKIIT